MATFGGALHGLASHALAVSQINRALVDMLMARGELNPERIRELASTASDDRVQGFLVAILGGVRPGQVN